MLAIVLLSTIAYIITDLYTQLVTANLSNKIKKKLFNKVLFARWNYIVSKKPGELLNSIFRETGLTMSAYKDVIEFLAILAQLIFYTIASFIVTFKISIYTYLAGIIIVLIFYSWNRKAKILV